MPSISEARVRVMQQIALGRNVHCLRLCLEDAAVEPAAPGQYCRLAGPGLEPQPCSYVSLPDHDGHFMVAAAGERTAVAVGERLDYRGPLGCGWPLPLRAEHLLLLVAEGGLLSLAALLDELGCWMPWVQLHLLCEPECFDALPQECRGWLHSLGMAPAARPQRAGGDSLARLLEQLRAQPPDLVFCSGPEGFNRASAQVCRQHGVAAENIWLRSDVLPPIVDPAAQIGPVFRLDCDLPSGRG